MSRARPAEPTQITGGAISRRPSFRTLREETGHRPRTGIHRRHMHFGRGDRL